MSDPRSVSLLKDTLGVAFALLITGLAVYAAVILKAGEWSNLPHAMGGSGSYFKYGLVWASGSGPLSNSRPPIYTLVVGLVFRLASPENAMQWMAALQVGLSLILLLAAYGIVRLRSGSVTAACCALTLIALNLSMLREFVSGRETLLFAMIVLLEFTLFSVPGPFGSIRALSLGVLCALGWLTRPTGIVLVPASAYLLLRNEAKGFRSRGTRLAALFSLGLLSPLAAWAGYQVATDQPPVIAGERTFLNLYLGNNEAFAAFYPLLDIEVLNEFAREKISAWQEEGKSPDAQMLRHSIDFLSAHPMEGLRLATLKALAFLTPRHFPRGAGRLIRTDEGWRIEGYEPVSALHDLLTFAALPGVLLLGLALARWKLMPPEVQFTCAVVLLALALHVLTFAETRFRQGFDPVLATSGVLAWIYFVRNRSFQRLDDGAKQG